MKFGWLKRKIKATYLSYRFHLKSEGCNFDIGKYCIFRQADCAQITFGIGFCARHFVTFNVSGKLVFGSRVFVNSYTSFNARVGIAVGNDTLIGEGVRFYDHDHDFRDPILAVNKSEFISKPISVGSNVWIGSNAIILKGVRIGNGSVIAAGAIVNRNVPEDCIYFSNQKIVPIKKRFRN